MSRQGGWRPLIVCLLAAACGGGQKKTAEPAKETLESPPKQPEGASEPDEGEDHVVVRGEMPPACLEYARRMQRCLDSPSFPRETLDETRAAFQTMLEGWDDLESMPEHAWKQAMVAADHACEKAAEGMVQPGEKICPGVWLPPDPAEAERRAQRRYIDNGPTGAKTHRSLDELPAGWKTSAVECEDYARRMLKCLESPEFPAAARQAVIDAFVPMIEGWVAMEKMPPEARRTALQDADDACRDAKKSMQEPGDAMCPSVW